MSTNYEQLFILISSLRKNIRRDTYSWLQKYSTFRRPVLQQKIYLYIVTLS